MVFCLRKTEVDVFFAQTEKLSEKAHKRFLQKTAQEQNSRAVSFCNRVFLDSKLLAAFLATTVDDFATIFGCHALAKTVLVFALAIAWLICH